MREELAALCKAYPKGWQMAEVKAKLKRDIKQFSDTSLAEKFEQTKWTIQSL